MSRDASVTFDWGDLIGCRFRLPIGELVSLQEKSGVSPFVVLERLQLGRPMVGDAREVLRHGLIGGGLTPVEAGRLVARWVDDRPLAESISPAIVVLSAALYGVPDESPGKSPGATEEPPPPPTLP